MPDTCVLSAELFNWNEYYRRRELRSRKAAWLEWATTQERICIACEKPKKIIDFTRDFRRQDETICAVCRKIQRTASTIARRSDPEWIKESKAKEAKRERKRTLARRGMTEGSFEALLKAQKDRCAACGTREPGGKHNQWNIDHCHNTKVVRGLLCNWCNETEHAGVSRVRKLLAYMEKYELFYSPSDETHVLEADEGALLSELKRWADSQPGRQGKIVAEIGVNRSRLWEWFSGKALPKPAMSLRIREFLEAQNSWASDADLRLQKSAKKLKTFCTI